MPEEKHCMICGKPIAPAHLLWHPETTLCGDPVCRREKQRLRYWRCKEAREKHHA